MAGTAAAPNAANLPIHDLHRLIVPGMIADMTPSLNTTERTKLAEVILSSSSSLQDLHRALEEIHQKHSN